MRDWSLWIQCVKLNNSFPLGSVSIGKPYLVTVCTVDKLFAGTNSKVHIKVFGDDGQFGETIVGEKFKSGWFVSGSLFHFNLWVSFTVYLTHICLVPKP